MRAQRTAKSASAKKRTTRRVSRSSKSRNVKSKYPDTFAECRHWFGLRLTDAQIEKYAASHPVLKRDVSEDVFETFDRDFFIDAVVIDVLGEDYHWPTNGDQDAYKTLFYPLFYAVALRKGIKLTVAARRIASMYNQLVISVPEKLGKKVTKAIKKKFGFHTIEGGTIHGGDSVSVTILANGVNPTLLTIVQIYAEGFVEGAK